MMGRRVWKTDNVNSKILGMIVKHGWQHLINRSLLIYNQSVLVMLNQ